MGEKAPRPAYVVDVEEVSGKRVPGSRRSAKTSTKEKPKVTRGESGRSDKSKRRDADVEHAAERAATGSGARKHEVITTEKEERRKSTSSSTHSPRKEKRPPSAHKNHSFPKLHNPFTQSKRDNPNHFGVPAAVPTVVSQPNMTQPIPVRPRAVTAQTYPTRPLSYHAAYTSTGAYGPPLSTSAWANYQPPPQPVTPSYPPPSPGYMRYAATPAPVSSDYFESAMSAPERPMSARPLASRFNPPSRTSSGFGYRDAHPQDIADAYSAGYHDDGYTSASDGVARRRESIRVPSGLGPRLSKAEQDYQDMPPPPAPRPILRRPITEYSADSIDGSYGEGRTLIRDDSRPRNPSSHRNSVSYDLGDGPERVRVETANNGRRRQSYYGQSASAGSSGYEDKIREAASYQQDVGETVPLTAEVLKRQRRQAGSSRSTKSSASRDESDWRKSATTRTTRSGSGEGENVTIKVTGTARVMVGGAQIDCPDGGEIEIKQQQKAIRNGSERSNSEYGGPKRIDDRRSRDGGPQRIDDRRSRDERGSGRSRMSSRHSYNRSKPQQYFGESLASDWI